MQRTGRRAGLRRGGGRRPWPDQWKVTDIEDGRLLRLPHAGLRRFSWKYIER
jgi:hypothetical protein